MSTPEIQHVFLFLSPLFSFPISDKSSVILGFTGSHECGDARDSDVQAASECFKFIDVPRLDGSLKMPVEQIDQEWGRLALALS